MSLKHRDLLVEEKIKPRTKSSCIPVNRSNGGGVKLNSKIEVWAIEFNHRRSKRRVRALSIRAKDGLNFPRMIGASCNCTSTIEAAPAI